MPSFSHHRILFVSTLSWFLKRYFLSSLVSQLNNNLPIYVHQSIIWRSIAGNWTTDKYSVPRPNLRTIILNFVETTIEPNSRFLQDASHFSSSIEVSCTFIDEAKLWSIQIEVELISNSGALNNIYENGHICTTHFQYSYPIHRHNIFCGFRIGLMNLKIIMNLISNPQKMCIHEYGIVFCIRDTRIVVRISDAWSKIWAYYHIWQWIFALIAFDCYSKMKSIECIPNTMIGIDRLWDVWASHSKHHSTVNVRE